jgi:hypothetical protein
MEARRAKNILAEIVRGIFLNSPDHLETIAEIPQTVTHSQNSLSRQPIERRSSWTSHDTLPNAFHKLVLQSEAIFVVDLHERTQGPAAAISVGQIVSPSTRGAELDGRRLLRGVRNAGRRFLRLAQS